MAELKSRLIQSMKSHGIDCVKDSTKWHLRRKLENQFSSALHIISAGPKKNLLYPDNLSLNQLAQEWQCLKEELHNLKSVCDEDILAKAALTIKSDIMAQDGPTAWPPQILEVAESEDLLPRVPQTLFYLFAYWKQRLSNSISEKQAASALIWSGYHLCYHKGKGEATKAYHSGLCCQISDWEH